jgi:hypothetical protein
MPIGHRPEGCSGNRNQRSNVRTEVKIKGSSGSNVINHNQWFKCSRP